MSPAVAIPTIAGGVFGIADAVGGRSAAKRGARSIQDAADVQAEQLDAQGEQAIRQNRREAAAALGRISVAASANNTELSDALKIQMAYDAAYNDNAIRKNLFMQREVVRTGAQANSQSLYNGLRNPLLSLAQGTLTGFQTGLGIQSALNTINTPPINQPLVGSGDFFDLPLSPSRIAF